MSIHRNFDAQERVIVVGAGIIGLMSALELAEHGYRVTIFDQAQAAKAASWAGGGILSPMYPWKYHPAINQLAQFGKRSYLALNERIMPVTGVDFEIEQVGMLIFDHDQYDKGLNYHHNFNEPEQLSELLQRDALHALNPHVHPDISSAIYFAQLANIRNPRLVRSLVLYLQQHQNVVFSVDNAIVELKQANGRVTAVQDSKGQLHQAEHIVIATGAWSAPLLSQVNVQVEIKPIHGQMVLYKTPAQWLPNMCMNNTMYLIPRRDGHIVCGSSTYDFGFDQRLHSHISQDIIQASIDLVPELKNFPIVQQWAGLRPGSPDGVPKIGRVPHLDNVWLNVGHYRNGLVMAPASAQLLRQQMLNQPTIVDPQPYQV